MQWFEILVVVLAVLFVGGVTGKAVVDKVRSGSTGCKGCGCGCSCSSCAHCKKGK
ncbi:MAG: FeoB-associated Cys-rich membrane protein [Christensenellaceae bacterium]